MQPLRRRSRPRAKKRHTKPCRFFQHDNCPLSAEECDFAHVLSNDVSFSTPSPCRYFAAGSCGNGSRCRFRHVMPSSEESDDMQTGSSPPEADQMKQDDSSVDSPIIERLAPWTMPFSMSMGGWRRPVYTGPMASPVFPPGLPLSPHVYYSDFYPRDSNRTISHPNSTSSSFSDDAAFVTEDPNYSEHYHQYQSRIRIIDSPPLVHVSPFYHSPPPAHGPLSINTSYVVPSMHNASGFAQPVSPSEPRPKAHQRSNVRHKIINYKTKPCRFYKIDGTCPNGSSCTFIHTGKTPCQSPMTSPRLLPVPPPATLPPKPLTLAEENKKKNFFPIPWRVIGGGVLMGSEPKASTMELTSPNMHKTTLEDSEPKKNINISLPKPVKRTRSSSIPPTPTIQHVDTGTLFSAESPGNL
ncbi:hypothetical protein H2248_007233 [Termitomyces sp. 'cryptogamus']|nr:hypothetical protein H2248_007233 [Termitomyces sp. 'cryptogamus']